MSSHIVSKIVVGTGRRLKQLRDRFNFSPEEMARKLNLSLSGYFKNERGNTFPGLKTLNRLQGEYDISMDWLIFGKGPVNYTQKPSARVLEAERGSGVMKDVSPEILQMVETMEQDPLLRAEMLVYFYRYREKKEAPVKSKKAAPLEKS